MRDHLRPKPLLQRPDADRISGIDRAQDRRQGLQHLCEHADAGSLAARGNARVKPELRRREAGGKVGGVQLRAHLRVGASRLESLRQKLQRSESGIAGQVRAVTMSYSWKAMMPPGAR